MKKIELGVGGDGQNTSRHFEGSFRSIRAIQKPESEIKVIELSYCHHFFFKIQAFRKKVCQNWTKNDQVMPNFMFLCKSGKKAWLFLDFGLKFF